jgi:hypothetical protein
LGRRLTTHHREIKLLCNVTQGLRLGEILWNYVRDEKWTRDFDLECGVYRSGSLRTGTGTGRNNAYRVVVGKLERKRPFGSPSVDGGGAILKWNSRYRIGGCKVN